MKKKNNSICQLENCNEKVVARGYCKKHYYQLRRKGLIGNAPKCKIDNCENISFSKGYCSRHYGQYYHNGEILQNTMYDLNEIIINKDYAEILLYKKNKEYSRTKIDLDDIEKVKKYRWSLSSHGYVKTGKETLYLHRYLMNIQDDELVVDHISGNTLDNRKANLRICTIQQNVINQGSKRANTSISGVKGVNWDNRKEKWVACIGFDYEKIKLGFFDTIKEAHELRKQAEEKYFGEYAREENNL